jgi:DNA (cytosine-5)-methyltransferase 1
LSTSPKKIWVLRSKNLDEYGNLVHIEGYDKYIDSLSGFYLEKFQKSEQIIFTNFTYNTRATILPKTSTVNGSFCILLPKIFINNINLSIYSSREFRLYYAIVKNLSKFTINVDSNSIYYIGIKKNV